MREVNSVFLLSLFSVWSQNKNLIISSQVQWHSQFSTANTLKCMFYEMNRCYPSITRGIWDIHLLVVMSFEHQKTLMYFISSLLGGSKYYNLFGVSLSLNIFFQPSGLTQISSPRISSPSLFLSPPWRISDCSRKASMASAKCSCWGKPGDETSSFTCLKNRMWEFCY